MGLSEILATLATGIHIVAFVLYNRKALKGDITPNVFSWAVWAFVTVLNFTSYRQMSQDWVKSLLPTISSLMCIVTFLVTFCIALWTGKCKEVDRWDLAALVLGLIAAGIWGVMQSATYTNLILQASIAIGFVPTYRGVWRLPKNETALPWLMWCVAFTIGLVIVMLRWEGQYQDLVYYINCIVLHLAVAMLSLRKPLVTAA